MTSPFPGMDPYLEASWGDVHNTLITYAREQLQPLLPPDLRARAEECLVVESPDSSRRTIRPDLHVSGRPRPRGNPAPPAEGAGIAVAEPLRFLIDDEPEIRRYLEILDIRSGRRIITALEILSPSNKAPGPGRDKYLQKQRELAEAGVNTIEIDLLRGGLRTLAVSDDLIPASHRTAYAAWVRRADSGVLEYYRGPLRERLPAIHIPLRPEDADVPLDVQALIDRCYLTGAYGDDLDYRADPVPPLDPADAAWADALLRERGFRGNPDRSESP